MIEVKYQILYELTPNCNKNGLSWHSNYPSYTGRYSDIGQALEYISSNFDCKKPDIHIIYKKYVKGYRKMTDQDYRHHCAKYRRS